MLVEIHMLQNHSPSNPNRDELGAPKTAVFGGCVRARISSQCLKRSIRLSEHFTKALGEHRGTRTKFFPDLVSERLEHSAIPEGEHSRIVSACRSIAKKEHGEAKAEKGGKADARPATAQLIFLGPDHANEFVARLAKSRTEMKEQYDYFLNPVASFQELVREQLANTELEEKDQDKIVKVSWCIAKLRMQELLLNDDGEPEPTPQFGPDGEPGEEFARVIASQMTDYCRSDPARFKELVKGPTKDEKKHLTDVAPDRPKKMDDFLERLNKAARYDAVDIALFGRMTTSDAFEDVEAAMEVAHAISVHEVFPQVDYFTAVDDLGKGSAAAHLGENQFNSSLYYKYFSLDWQAFIDRLLGPEPNEEDFKKDKKAFEEARRAREARRPEMTKLAARGLVAFLRAAACAVPTGKKKGHANNNLPDDILIEIKKKNIPTNYANAFLKPVQPNKDRDLMKESVRELGHYVGSVVRGFEIDSRRLWYSSTGLPLEYQPKRQESDNAPPPAETMGVPVATFPELIRRTLQELGQDPALADETEGQA